MAQRIIFSPLTKEKFIFDDNWNDERGFVSFLKYEIQPFGKVMSHFHPRSAQSFKVLAGELEIKVDGKKKTLKMGEEEVTKIGSCHAQKNTTSEVCIVMEGYNPPINIEPFFTVLPHAFASKNIWKICIFFDDFSKIVSSHTISFTYIVPFLARIGRKLNYSKWYTPLIQHLNQAEIK